MIRRQCSKARRARHPNAERLASEPSAGMILADCALIEPSHPLKLYDDPSSTFEGAYTLNDH